MKNNIKQLMTNGYSRVQAEMICKAMKQQGGLQSPQEEQIEGQSSNPQEEQGEMNPEQLMQQIAQALQNGADPQQILQQLVQMGMEQNQAMQLVQGVIQQLQQSQPIQEEQPMAQQGDTFWKKFKFSQYSGVPDTLDLELKNNQEQINPLSEGSLTLGKTWAEKNPLPKEIFPNDLNLETPLVDKYNYDENGNVEKEYVDNYKMYNPYGGVDIASRLNYGAYNAGLGNTGSAIVGLGGAGLGIAREFFSGLGMGKEAKRTQREYQDKQYGHQGEYQMAQQGGKTMADLITGDYKLPVDRSQSNVEIEKGEITKDPETGEIQEALGKSHEQGGTPVNLKNGTEILSDHTKVGVENAKIFTEQFGVKISAKDTFADVIDKATRALGITKLNEEQANLAEKAEKILKKDGVDQTTQGLNMELISKKLQEIEEKKQPLEEVRKQIFDAVFKEQEKIPKTNTEYNTAQEGRKFNTNTSSVDSLRHQATKMMNFEEKKGSPTGTGLPDWGYHSSQLPYDKAPTNWTPPKTKDEAVNLYMKEIGTNPILTHFPSAMEKGEAGDFLYNTGRDPRVYMLDQYLKSKGQAGLPNRGSYNVDTKTENWTPELQNSLDTQWKQHSSEISKLPVNKRRILLNKGRDFYYQNINQVDGKPNPSYEATWKPRIWESVNNYQEGGTIQDNRILEIANKYGINPQRAMELIPKAQQGIKTGEVIANKQANYIKKPVDISGLPYNPRETGEDIWKGINYENEWLPLVDKSMETDEKAKVIDDYLTQYKDQYSDNVKKQLEGLTGKARYAKIKELATDKFPGIFHNLMRQAITATQPTQEQPIEEKAAPQQKETVYRDKVMFPSFPDALVMPPSAPQSVYKADTKLPYLDPVKMSIEPNLVENARQSNAATNQANYLPDFQRAALQAQILGSTQQANNQAISTAEAQNAQNQFQTDQYNANVLGKNRLMEAQNALDYERRVFAGQNAFENNLQNYYNFFNKQNALRDLTVNKANAYNALNENYKVGNGDINYNDTALNLINNIGATEKSMFDKLSAKEKKSYIDNLMYKQKLEKLT